MKRLTLLSLVLAGCVSLSAHGVLLVDAKVGWVREYFNPFDPDFDRDAVKAGPATTDDIKITVLTPGWNLDVTRPLQRIVNRVDGPTLTIGGGRVTKTNGKGEVVGITFQAPQAFKAGTIITFQYIPAGSFEAGSSMPYNIQLGTGGATANWTNALTATSGLGMANSTQIQVASALDWGNGVAGTYDTFRLNITAVKDAGTTNNTAYADFNEVIILPDVLVQLEGVKAAASHTTSGSAANLVDNKADTGWQARAGVSGGPAAGTQFSPTLTFTLGTAAEPLQQVDAIVFSSWTHSALNQPSNFTLKDGAGNVLAHITMVPENGRDWILPLEFTKSLVTDKIVMEFDAGTDFLFRDVMFFRKVVVPEPATMSLLAMGGLALLRRRK